MLHVNFTMLWKPAIGLIKSHAHSLGVDEFWQVFAAHVQEAAERTGETVYIVRRRHALSNTRAVKMTRVGFVSYQIFVNAAVVSLKKDGPAACFVRASF